MVHIEITKWTEQLLLYVFSQICKLVLFNSNTDVWTVVALGIAGADALKLKSLSATEY